jgi:hypothetical protein
MKKTLLFLFAFVWVIFLSGCSTNEAITCYLPNVPITSNSPLVPGATLQLNTPPGYESDVSYNWSGPNNFQSNLQNPSIADVKTSMAGEYKLKTTKGICESKESTVLVEITAPNIPCNPDNNTVVFNGNDKYSIYYVYLGKVSDNYSIEANGYGASLIIDFADYVTPEPGIYSICKDCPTSFLKSNEVCVTLYHSDYSNAREGFVYISKIDGKLVVQFCDLKFQFNSFNYTVSSKLTVR